MEETSSSSLNAFTFSPGIPLKRLHIGLSGLPGFDPNPFVHIWENFQAHLDLPIRAGDIGHDAAAVLVKDGQPVFAVEEERLNRMKHFVGIPHMAMSACLAASGMAVGELSVSHYVDLSESHLLARISACGNRLLDEGIRREFNQLLGFLEEFRRHVPGARPVDHHEAHAGSAYYLSGFDRSLILVLDGSGESASISIMLGEAGAFRSLASLPITSSLGLLFAEMTYYLGFEPIEDEYKVMGLAAYGGEDEYRGFFDEAIQWEAEDRFTIPCLLESPLDRLLHWVRRLGPQRTADSVIEARYIAIAHSLQRALERTILRLLEHHEGIHKTGHLCLAGGVALNCSLNGAIDRSGLFDCIFVQPAASDPGAALGAALVDYHRENPGADSRRLESIYLGPSYTRAQVLETLEAFGNQVEWERPEDYMGAVSALLAQGKIIAWFQGRMEFGPRALGNRSILADPRRPDMKDRVNQVVKKREEFRPFAPSVTVEAADSFFELRSLDQYEHMTIAVKTRPGRADSIPAVVHVDGTARVQVVRREANPGYWELITRFGQDTGVPVLLNTSFNVRGEPIVCSPEDAIRCMLGTGIDVLAMEGYLIRGKEQG